MAGPSAASLGRAPSVTSREIARNTTTDGTYLPGRPPAGPGTCRTPETTQARYLPRPTLSSGGITQRAYLPVCIANRLKAWFGTHKAMTVSHETFYLQGAGALRHELSVDYALRSGRTGRKPASKLPARGRGAKPWVDGARYADRLATAADRAVPGHWEGDLVIG